MTDTSKFLIAAYMWASSLIAFSVANLSHNANYGILTLGIAILALVFLCYLNSPLDKFTK